MNNIRRYAASALLLITVNLTYAQSETDGLRTHAPKVALRASPHAGPNPAKRQLPSMFRDGEIFIKVSVNGAPDAWMNLDTGTSPSVIDHDYAQSIGLTLRPSKQGTEGFGAQKIPTFHTGKVHLRAGAASNRLVKFESIRLQGMRGPDGVALAGLLGESFLQGKELVIDYKRQEVYFLNGDIRRERHDVPMSLKGGVPVVQLNVGSRVIKSLIDSGGSYGLLLTPAAAKNLGAERFMDDAKTVATFGHGGEHAAKVGKAPDVAIGEIVGHDITAVYTTFGTAAIDAGASMGKDFLKNYKITLDYRRKIARFEP